MSAHCEKCGIELGLELDCWACDLRAERDRYREAWRVATDEAERGLVERDEAWCVATDNLKAALRVATDNLKTEGRYRDALERIDNLAGDRPLLTARRIARQALSGGGDA